MICKRDEGNRNIVLSFQRERSYPYRFSCPLSPRRLFSPAVIQFDRMYCSLRSYSASQVGQVSLCFGKAFQRPSNSLLTSSANSEELDGNMVNVKSVQTCVFEVGLEVKEDDGKVSTRFIIFLNRSFSIVTNFSYLLFFFFREISTMCPKTDAD